MARATASSNSVRRKIPTPSCVEAPSRRTASERKSLSRPAPATSFSDRAPQVSIRVAAVARCRFVPRVRCAAGALRRTRTGFKSGRPTDREMEPFHSMCPRRLRLHAAPPSLSPDRSSVSRSQRAAPTPLRRPRSHCRPRAGTALSQLPPRRRVHGLRRVTPPG